MLLAVALLGGLASTAGATSTKTQLQQAKAQLASLEREIASQRAALASIQREVAAQQARLQTIQGELNVLAGKIDVATSQYEETQQQVADTQASLDAARAKYRALRDRLNQRARAMYENGPGGSLEVILGSTSLAELSDRLAFVDQLSQADADLANRVQNRANALSAQKAALEAVKAKEAAELADLNTQQRALNAKFAEEEGIYRDLASKEAQAAAIARDLDSKRAQVDALVTQLQKKLKAEQLAAARAAAEAARKAAEAARKAAEAAKHHNSGGSTGGGSTGGGSTGGGSTGANPLDVCPVAGPHAYSDSFGAPRYGGGFHLHAGIDIMAPRDTPVVAPFPGRASEDYNGLGGNSVFVYGSQGYMYGAHLDHYPSPFPTNVSAGTVIGYVGNTGDAAGGPTHLHFEWHPNVIPANPYRSSYGATVIDGAIDSYPYLNQVC